MHGLELQNGDPSEWRAAFSAHSGPVLGFLRGRLPPGEMEMVPGVNSSAPFRAKCFLAPYTRRFDDQFARAARLR
jgi:hypothetical protein